MSIRNFRDETVEVSGLDFSSERICRRKRKHCAARKCGRVFFDGEVSGRIKKSYRGFWERGWPRSGRFGKYGDLKRKEQIRSTRVSRSETGQDPIYIGSSGPGDPPRETAEEVKHFMEESATCHQEKKKANVTVRRMEIDDIATVFHLGEKLFTASEVPNLFRTWDEYEVINYFQNDSEFCLVAQTCDEAETIIGFLLGTTVTKSHSAWKYGYLVWLGVDPVFHEMGVGAKLFKRFRDLMVADGARMLLVDSQADNEAALHFFSKMGFRASSGTHLPCLKPGFAQAETKLPPEKR